MIRLINHMDRNLALESGFRRNTFDRVVQSGKSDAAKLEFMPAKDEIGGYFLDRINPTAVSEDLWMKVLNNTNGKEVGNEMPGKHELAWSWGLELR